MICLGILRPLLQLIGIEDVLLPTLPDQEQDEMERLAELADKHIRSTIIVKGIGNAGSYYGLTGWGRTSGSKTKPVDSGK